MSEEYAKIRIILLLSSYDPETKEVVNKIKDEIAKSQLLTKITYLHYCLRMLRYIDYVTRY